MDENYFNLLKYLGCDRLFITFTKSPGEEYYIFQGCKIPEHNQIDWNQTIKEFKDISNIIERTIGINAIRAYYILGNAFPHQYLIYIEKYIQTYFVLEKENIKFNENKILINQFEILAHNEHSLFHQLFDLKIKTVYDSNNKNNNT